jgi:hypothetical protein
MRKNKSIEAHADSSTLRIGAQAPSPPARTTDSGKVRLGAQTPSLPRK